MKPPTAGKFMREKNVIIGGIGERLGCREKAPWIMRVVMFGCRLYN